MTYETYYDKDSGKEIHFVLFPDDPFTGSPIEIEIQAVYITSDIECDWTDEEETEWVDEITRRVNS